MSKNLLSFESGHLLTHRTIGIAIASTSSKRNDFSTIAIKRSNGYSHHD
jgi:hypothetical protein